MANEEIKKEGETASFKEDVKQAGFAPMEESLTVLAKSGGFDFLEAIVDGADNLNPARKAKKNIFHS